MSKQLSNLREACRIAIDTWRSGGSRNVRAEDRQAAMDAAITNLSSTMGNGFHEEGIDAEKAAMELTGSGWRMRMTAEGIAHGDRFVSEREVLCERVEKILKDVFYNHDLKMMHDLADRIAVAMTGETEYAKPAV